MNFKVIKDLKPYLLVALVPLIFTFIFGEMFSPIYIRDIPVAVMDMDGSSNSTNVIKMLNESENLKIHEEYTNMQEIKEKIIEGKLCGAILIPKGFGENIRAKKGAQATVLMDNANFMLGNNLTSAINTIFETVNAGIQIKYLEAGAQVPFEARQNVYTLSLADRILYNPQLSYIYYMYPGFLAIFIQQTYLAALVPLLIEEKDRLKDMSNHHLAKELINVKAGLFLRRIMLLIGLSLISTMVCIKVAGGLCAVPMRGNIVDILILQIFFMFSLTGISILIATVFEQVAHGAQFTMFLTIPTFLSCGYAWPYYLVDDRLELLFELTWPLNYFVNPLKDVMLKAQTVEIDFLLKMLAFGIIWLFIGAVFFKRKVEMIREYSYS
ncbi:MAG: ABC transporter permease [Eubacteriales bacterium]